MNKRRKLLYYIKNYRFNSYLIRNFSVTILVIIGPLIIIGWYFLNSTGNFINAEIDSSNKEMLYKIADVNNNILQETNLITTYLSQNSNINVFVLSEQPEDILTNTYTKVHDAINMFSYIYKYIDSIYIYSEDKGIILSKDYDMSIKDFTDLTWIEAYKNAGDKLQVIQSRKKNDNYPYLISFIRPIVGQQGKNKGAVIVNLDVEEIGKILNGADSHNGQLILIADQSDTIMYSNNTADTSNKAENIPNARQLIGKKSEYSTKMDISKTAYIVSGTTSNSFGWKYILARPMQYYEDKMQKMSTIFVVIIIVCSILSLFISLILAIKSFQPVRNILSILDDPEEWTASQKKAVKRKDEVAEIADRIMFTVHSNIELEKELKERLGSLYKAQIGALQAQINPHFLYNTLETINWMAIDLIDGKNDVSDMLHSLSNLLRTSLDIDDYLITISDELENAKLYVKILEIRYKNMFEVKWELSPEVYKYKIIKLCLQPIIENAVYHGIMPKNSFGSIRITDEITDSSIILRIVDDGVGIEEGLIQELNFQLDNVNILKGEHIGLKNANQRIKLVFGDSYGLVVENNQKQGTIVSITIPKIA